MHTRLQVSDRKINKKSHMTGSIKLPGCSCDRPLGFHCGGRWGHVTGGGAIHGGVLWPLPVWQTLL